MGSALPIQTQFLPGTGMKKLRWLLYCVCVFYSLQGLSSEAYYPDYFWRDYNSGKLEDSELKNELFRILSLYHNPTLDGGDQIDTNCQNNNCYRHDPVSYKHARKVLFGHIHLKNFGNEYGVQDVYCDKFWMASEFPSKPPGPMQIPNSQIVNAEHTWPQSRFSNRHSKGTQKSDLHGLYPVYSRVNSSRGNSPFGEVSRIGTQICEPSAKGPSDTSGRSVFEPPQNHKGNVARALFYFSVRYQMEIDDEQEAYLRLWNTLDPVDVDEFNRNEIVFETQFNRNPFVDIPDLAENIVNF